jgi:hypothetical protein
MIFSPLDSVLLAGSKGALEGDVNVFMEGENKSFIYRELAIYKELYCKQSFKSFRVAT